MDAPGPSSGGKKPRSSKKLKSVIIPLRFKDSTGLPIGSLTLDKPSGVLGAPKWAREVCFDLADANCALSFKIMVEIYHENVLHLESVISKKESLIKICVEPYTHSLRNFAATLIFDRPSDFEMIQSLIRQIMEGMHELMLNGLYHGNFTIETTYYDKSARLVKLANFQSRDEMGVEEAQFNDWHAVGKGIATLSSMYKKKTRANYLWMDDLAHKLQGLSPSAIIPLVSIKDNMLNEVFFWKKIRRANFFMYGILGPLHSNEFITKVAELDFIPHDWSQTTDQDLFSAMNKYRTKDGGSPYGSGKHQYILYVSGSYTHESELLLVGDVDNIITEECPRLCLELVNIVRQLGYAV